MQSQLGCLVKHMQGGAKLLQIAMNDKDDFRACFLYKIFHAVTRENEVILTGSKSVLPIVLGDLVAVDRGQVPFFTLVPAAVPQAVHAADHGCEHDSDLLHLSRGWHPPQAAERNRKKNQPSIHF